MLEQLRDINFLSVTVRMFCAVLCGGLIGYERESEGKNAGFRTHIMICVGSAMVTATSQYLFLILHQYTDMARLGAQVIAGLGFIGAGSIMVTQYRRIKGLTTAAGLWVTGIIGLCSGAGFYEGALLAALLLFAANKGIGGLEKKYFIRTTNVSLYIEYGTQEKLKNIMDYLRDVDVLIEGFELNQTPNQEFPSSGIFHLKLHRKILVQDIVSDLRAYGLISNIHEV